MSYADGFWISTEYEEIQAICDEFEINFIDLCSFDDMCIMLF